jgi:hypothetical protein
MNNQYVVMNDEIYDHTQIVLSLFFTYFYLFLLISFLFTYFYLFLFISFIFIYFYLFLFISFIFTYYISSYYFFKENIVTSSSGEVGVMHI